ncbi:MAG: hypothetical protein NWE94_04410 [Candidatus Bathyarchaeota archaeon]|nr:hypothetical protein [Candidatus Bathyarchaeota archaeon]
MKAQMMVNLDMLHRSRCFRLSILNVEITYACAVNNVVVPHGDIKQAFRVSVSTAFLTAFQLVAVASHHPTIEGAAAKFIRFDAVCRCRVMPHVSLHCLVIF